MTEQSNDNRLKYLYSEVTLQEVPDEIALTLSVTGCPRQCKNCHSPELRKNKGSYLLYDLKYLIVLNPEITCVCFMGGDHNKIELQRCASLCKRHGIKTCLYSGSDDKRRLIRDYRRYFDYIKVGSYKEELGGIDKPTSNQRMYKKTLKGLWWRDITYKFQQEDI